MRRLDIFVADLSGLDLEEVLERLAALLDHADIGAIDRVLKASIVFERKFAVDRQPARRAVLAASGKLDRVFDHVTAARPSGDVLCILAWRQHFIEQRAELHLAPASARLDVGHDPLEVTHAHRQRLHLAQALVHLLQAVRHHLERFTEALLERGLQLLVDRRAHLLELGGVVGAQRVQALLDRDAHGVEALLVRLREFGQLFAEALQLPVLNVGHVGQLLLRAFPEFQDRAAHFVAQACGRIGVLLARIREVLPDIGFHARHLRTQGVAAGTRVGGIASRGARFVVAGPAECGNAQQPDDAQHQDDDQQHQQDDRENFRHRAASLLGQGKRSKGGKPVFAHVIAARQSSHAGIKVDGAGLAQNCLARIGPGQHGCDSA